MCISIDSNQEPLGFKSTRKHAKIARYIVCGNEIPLSHCPRILDSLAVCLLANTKKRHNIIRKRTSRGGSFHWNAQVSSDDDDKETMMMMTVPILDLISGE